MTPAPLADSSCQVSESAVIAAAFWVWPLPAAQVRKRAAAVAITVVNRGVFMSYSFGVTACRSPHGNRATRAPLTRKDITRPAPLGGAGARSRFQRPAKEAGTLSCSGTVSYTHLRAHETR